MRRLARSTRIQTLMAAFALIPACGRSPTEATEAMASYAHTGAPPNDYGLVLPAIQLRPGATADVHVRILVNEKLPCRDPARTALAVHGINGTAATWARLAESFFRGPEADQLCRFVALDQPGHGLSGLPVGLTFGELVVEDFARVLVQVLDRLDDRGIHPSILIGHSQGTLAIQTAQQMLGEDGGSLRTRHDVRHVVMLGTQGPAQVPAEFAVPTDQLIVLINSLMTTTAEKGTFIQGPPEIFRQLWFMNRSFEVSEDAPSPQEIADNGWNEDAPLAATLQAAGLGLLPPAIDAGILGPASGIALHVVDLADDPWSLNADAIYTYLTGDPTLSGLVVLTDPDHEAVHQYAITEPDRVRDVIPLPTRGFLASTRGR